MSPRTSHTEYAPTPDAPARARHHLRTLAATWPIPADVLESAELALSELITNARAPRGALSYPRLNREELKGGSWV